jgi:mannose/fructose/N-acetylgalactosamine-specific phosphotransferase system component IID
MSAFPSRPTGGRLGSMPPKSWTIVACAAVAATSVIMTYLITLALGLALTGFGFLVALATISRVSFVGILLAAFALIVGVTVLWSLVPRKVSLDFAGTPIDLSQEVRLREELEAIAQAMGERMPKEVYLIPARTRR